MKIIKILTISFCIMLMLTQNIFALGDIITTADNFIDTGTQHTNTTMDTEQLSEMSGKIYNMLLALAVVAAVIVGAILGVQFMTAGVEKKVEVKQSLFPYIVSCVVVFGALGIWKIAVAIAQNI